MAQRKFIKKERIDKGWSCDQKYCVTAKDGTKYLMQYIDGLSYKIKTAFDFSFISQYGKVFQIFDDQDSGNICFGTEKDREKYFLKFAGAPTEAYSGTAEDAIKRLKETLPVYENLKHKNLIELIEAEEIGGGFLMVFRWADGDCMGRMYPSAHRRFMQLPIKAKCLS